MALTGQPFLLLVGAATAAAFVGVVLVWPRLAARGVARIAGRAGLLAAVNLLVLLTASTQLNAQYLFFADWTDLQGALAGAPPVSSVVLPAGAGVPVGAVGPLPADRSPSGQAAAVAPVLPPLPPGRMNSDGVMSFMVAGAASGLTGKIMVQVPPGYTDPGQSSTRYPVLETFQGYPSSPAQWIGTMHLGAVMARAVAGHRMRSALIVSPQLEFPAGKDTECVNGRVGAPQVETWLTQDVPAWVSRTFRVAADRGSWATIGLSSGGWCAAMTAMLHPVQYGAAVVMGGYFRPDFSGVAGAWSSGGAAARYDLIALARRAPPPVALWVQTSRSDPVSYGSTAALLGTVRPPLAVTSTVLDHAGHRTSIWQGLLPGSLAWLGATATGFAPQA